MLAAETCVSRCLKGLVRVDIGLAAASIALLAAGFVALLSEGTDAIWSGSTELQAGPETTFAAAVGRIERAPEPLAASAPCDTFNDRFASAFGSAGNAAAKVASAEVHDDDALPQQPDETAATEPIPIPETTERQGSLRQEKLNAAEASMSLRLPLDPDSHTAIYDIAARTVYLPNGNRLEAHSGLGSRLDDPRYVRTKMQGPTPPNVYNLTLREQLFHGVRAIRLIPVDGGKMFGRDGILAHTYMLGPRGQSNGCVSFRNYPAFLNAFLKGEVNRLVVVEHLATTTGAKASQASGG
jgi:hypothetical protein